MSGAVVQIDWTGAVSEDVSHVVHYYAVGSIDQRGRWDILDWLSAFSWLYLYFLNPSL